MINRPKPLLCVEHIEKYYGNQGSVTKALNQVSFYVQHGEFVSIMGASGSGKTTLLNCISTIDTVSAGHILLDGKDTLRRRKLDRYNQQVAKSRWEIAIHALSESF